MFEITWELAEDHRRKPQENWGKIAWNFLVILSKFFGDFYMISQVMTVFIESLFFCVYF